MKKLTESQQAALRRLASGEVIYVREPYSKSEPQYLEWQYTTSPGVKSGKIRKPTVEGLEIRRLVRCKGKLDGKEKDILLWFEITESGKAAARELEAK
jgi:hypothetical protein